MDKKSKEKIKKLREEGKYDEIFAKYGLEAQNKALAEVRALEATDAVMQQSENDFEERISCS